ncbi:unnamed protein product [Gadus morhua 'NCC']
MPTSAAFTFCHPPSLREDSAALKKTPVANTTIQSLALQSPPSPRGPPPSSSSASTQPPASSTQPSASSTTQPSASSTTQPPAPSTQPHSQDIRPAVAAALLQLISHRDPSSSEEEEAQEAQGARGSRHGAKEPDSSPRPSTAAEEAPVGRGVAAVPQFPKDQDLRFTHSAAR